MAKRTTTVADPGGLPADAAARHKAAAEGVNRREEQFINKYSNGPKPEEPEYLSTEETAARLGMVPGWHMVDIANTGGVTYRGPQRGQGDLVRFGRFVKSDVEFLAVVFEIGAARDIGEHGWLTGHDLYGDTPGITPGEMEAAAKRLELLGVRTREQVIGFQGHTLVNGWDAFRIVGIGVKGDNAAKYRQWQREDIKAAKAKIGINPERKEGIKP